MKEKLAIITSGGGMKCAWQVGAMLALAKNFGVTSPDVLISASGSSGTGSYYTAQQYDSMQNIRGNLLSTKKLVDLKRFWKIINIDYLIDEVFKKQDPLDQSEVHNSPINYIIPALQAKTAEVIYSSSKDLVDTFEAMRASMAMPIGFKMNPQIAVANELCCDSMLTTNPQTHISKAIALGATKILIIDVLNKNTRGPQHFLFNLWVKSRSKDFKDRYQFLDNQGSDEGSLAGVNIFTLGSQELNPVRTVIDNDQGHLKQAIEMAYDATSSNKELDRFLIS